MNLNNLARELCKREGLKKQISIADAKEVIKVLADIWAESPKEFLDLLFNQWCKNTQKKKKAKAVKP